jgi:hypothetical protein
MSELRAYTMFLQLTVSTKVRYLRGLQLSEVHTMCCENTQLFKLWEWDGSRMACFWVITLWCIVAGSRYFGAT